MHRTPLAASVDDAALAATPVHTARLSIPRACPYHTPVHTAQARCAGRAVGASLLESRCAHVLTVLDTCHAINRNVHAFTCTNVNVHAFTCTHMSRAQPQCLLGSTARAANVVRAAQKRGEALGCNERRLRGQTVALVAAKRSGSSCGEEQGEHSSESTALYTHSPLLATHPRDELKQSEITACIKESDGSVGV